MRHHLGNANLLVILLVGIFAGCGESAPEKPAAFVADASAQPIRGEPQSAEPARVEVARDPGVVPASYEATSTLPPVLLTQQHEALCRVQVGDTLPAITLPKIGGGQARLAELYGPAATVVVFWKSDRHMARDELADLGPDVVEAFGSQGVAVVGVAVEESARDARAVLRKAGAKFTNLVDADGSAFAKVGSQRLPWTLVLDASGKIVWFDIEYSHATRRELVQALMATVR